MVAVWQKIWIPAFAGMTHVKHCLDMHRHSGESRNPEKMIFQELP